VVIFIDADIMCPSGFIKAHVNAHKRNMKSARTSKLLILGGRENVDLEEGRVHKDYRLSGEWARGDRKIWEFMGGSNFSIMREDLRKVGEFDRNYDGAWGYEDTDLAYRALEEGVKIEFLPDILVYHMHHTPTGMAKQKRNREYFHKKFGLRDKG
jgi:GT2 family glycosyltransferase